LRSDNQRKQPIAFVMHAVIKTPGAMSLPTLLLGELNYSIYPNPARKAVQNAPHDKPSTER